MTVTCTSCSEQMRQFSPHRYFVKSWKNRENCSYFSESTQQTRDGRQLVLGGIIYEHVVGCDFTSKNRSASPWKVVYPYRDTTAFSAGYLHGLKLTLSCARPFRQNDDKVCTLQIDMSKAPPESRGMVGTTEVGIRTVSSGRANTSVP
jgi:transposase